MKNKNHNLEGQGRSGRRGHHHAGRKGHGLKAGLTRAMFGGRERHGHGRHGAGGRFGPGDPTQAGPGGWGFGGPFGGGPFGRGGGGGDGRGPRHGGRRRRLFDQAELQVLLLALIAEQPRHGYDLIREIEALSGGEYAPSPGVVYPALTYMEEADLITVLADQGTRKAFALTDAGRIKAAEDAEKAAALKERLSALADQRDKVDPAPVRRAIHALKTAVFDRLSHGTADRALILEVADAIDEATRRIERIGA